jgi:hypothetical protein
MTKLRPKPVNGCGAMQYIVAIAGGDALMDGTVEPKDVKQRNIPDVTCESSGRSDHLSACYSNSLFVIQG